MRKLLCKYFPHKMKLHSFEYPYLYYKCVRCKVVARPKTDLEKVGGGK